MVKVIVGLQFYGLMALVFLGIIVLAHLKYEKHKPPEPFKYEHDAELFKYEHGGSRQKFI